MYRKILKYLLDTQTYEIGLKLKNFQTLYLTIEDFEKILFKF